MSNKQFLVLGAGRFGSALATTLFQMGHEVVVVDSNEEMIEALMNEVTHAVIADATEESTLQKLGIQNFDTVIVAIGQDLEANILATVAAQSSGAKYVISKARDAMAARVLAQIGANEIVQPEHDMGVRLAKQLESPSILEALEFGPKFSALEVEVNDQLCGSLAELELPRRFGLQVVSVSRGDSAIVSPTAEYILEKGDTILLIGANRSVDKFQEFLSD